MIEISKSCLKNKEIKDMHAQYVHNFYGQTLWLIIKTPINKFQRPAIETAINICEMIQL